MNHNHLQLSHTKDFIDIIDLVSRYIILAENNSICMIIKVKFKVNV